VCLRWVVLLPLLVIMKGMRSRAVSRFLVLVEVESSALLVSRSGRVWCSTDPSFFAAHYSTSTAMSCTSPWQLNCSHLFIRLPIRTDKFNPTSYISHPSSSLCLPRATPAVVAIVGGDFQVDKERRSIAPGLPAIQTSVRIQNSVERRTSILHTTITTPAVLMGPSIERVAQQIPLEPSCTC
jgi:hypothetical protein